MDTYPKDSSNINLPVGISDGGTGATTASGARTSLSAAKSGANSDITSLTGLTTPLPVAEGGTGSSTVSGARTNLSAAQSGANADLTSIIGSLTQLGMPISFLSGSSTPTLGSSTMVTILSTGTFTSINMPAHVSGETRFYILTNEQGAQSTTANSFITLNRQGSDLFAIHRNTGIVAATQMKLGPGETMWIAGLDGSTYGVPGVTVWKLTYKGLISDSLNIASTTTSFLPYGDRCITFTGAASGGTFTLPAIAVSGNQPQSIVNLYNACAGNITISANSGEVIYSGTGSSTTYVLTPNSGVALYHEDQSTPKGWRIVADSLATLPANRGGTGTTLFTSGQATFVTAGSVAVADTTITASSIVVVTEVGTGPADKYSVAVSAGVGFTVYSDNAISTKTVNYQRVK